MRRAAAWRVLLCVALAALGAACASGHRHVLDLQGRPSDPLARAGLVVLLFSDTECPISNAYAPEVRRLEQEFSARGVRFYLVYADRTRSAAEVRAHVQAYGYELPALLDGAHELVRAAGASTTPEAAVFLDGELQYRGRIDDRYFDLGKQRAAAGVRDLHAALEALLAGGRPAQPWAPAIGCTIPVLQ